MSAVGPKIIAALEEATRGDFASVTIDGQRWVRSDVLQPLLEVLEPFAAVADEYPDELSDNYPVWTDFRRHASNGLFSLGQFRTARLAFRRASGGSQ